MAASGSDRKSTRLNSSHLRISYAVFCLKKKHMRELIRLPRERLFAIQTLEPARGPLLPCSGRRRGHRHSPHPYGSGYVVLFFCSEGATAGTSTSWEPPAFQY